jgi:hypothetical protein
MLPSVVSAARNDTERGLRKSVRITGEAQLAARGALTSMSNGARGQSFKFSSCTVSRASELLR